MQHTVTTESKEGNSIGRRPVTGSKDKLRLKNKINELGMRKGSTKTSTRGESVGRGRARSSAGKFIIKKGAGDVSPNAIDDFQNVKILHASNPSHQQQHPYGDNIIVYDQSMAGSACVSSINYNKAIAATVATNKKMEKFSPYLKKTHHISNTLSHRRMNKKGPSSLMNVTLTGSQQFNETYANATTNVGSSYNEERMARMQTSQASSSALQEKSFEPQSAGAQTTIKKLGNQSFSISSGPTRTRKKILQ